MSDCSAFGGQTYRTDPAVSGKENARLDDGMAARFIQKALRLRRNS